MSFVERIRQSAEKKGLKLANIEKELGFGNGTIRKWDNNSPSCEKALKVANLLNVSVEWLITGKQNIDLSKEDKELLNAYHTANTEAKEIVKFTLEISRKTNKKLEGEKSSISKTG